MSNIINVGVTKETLPTLNNPATSSDILEGKEAIGSDKEVITGSYVPLDTSDATATASDIINGKTAYVNGIKIVGTYIPPSLPTIRTITAQSTQGYGNQVLSTTSTGIPRSSITIGIEQDFYILSDRDYKIMTEY